MAIHRIRRGLDLAVLGEPEQVIHPAQPVSRVALLGDDYRGLKQQMRVSVGDVVTRGQPLLDDQNLPGVIHTSPAAGTIAAINLDKGELLSIVVELSDGERAGSPGENECQRFASYSGKPIPALSRDDVRALMIESGLWTAFRTRPFGRTPAANAVPDAIFINGMDTEPLAPKPEVVVAERAADFDAGLAVIAKLREGAMFLCVAQGSSIKAGPYSGIAVEHFTGPHPAGTPGTHIHTLFPVSGTKTAWHIGYQDVIRIGVLAKTGRLDAEQVVALAGPAAKSPHLVRTRIGASIREVTNGELKSNAVQLMSGSVLAGRELVTDTTMYLGRFHRQIICLNEARSKQTWLAVRPSKLASMLPAPFGLLGKALPTVRKPAALLRALQARDAATAERLGCLELDEDDVAVYSALVPDRRDHASALRAVLDTLERGAR